MQQLLNNIFTIVEQDRKEIKEKLEHGEMFNIFEVLGMETDEVRTHSAFIASLLDPKGKHSCSDLFLKAFIDVTDCSDLKLDTKNASVDIEVDTGPIRNKGTEGGILDILIESEDKALIIENKIYATDQSNQILRYYNYAKKSYKKHRILYLTLDGHAPSISSSEEDIDYRCINYRDEILPWLEKCEEIVHDKPTIQCLIHQYQRLIKKLTNQMSNDKHEKEIMNLLCSKENAEKTAVILDKYEEIKEFFIQEFFISKLNTWAKKQGMEILELEGWWFCYRPKNWKNHFIGYGRKEKRHFIQIYRDGGRKHKCWQLKCFKKKPASYWPFGYIECSNYINSMESVTSGKSLENVKTLIKSILKEIDTISKSGDFSITL